MDDNNPPDGAQPIEKTVVATLVPEPVTNFQLVPDNGGYILLLGKRRLKITDANFGTFPTPEAEVFAAAFLSHSMMVDLSKVLNKAVTEFEKMWGHIPMPGIDKPLE